ncbi:MAG: sugar phosphate isomerase/epimerase [Devosia sp.]
MTDLPDLMSLYWTNSGIFPGEAEISPHSFEARVKATAKAGFRGIGLWHTDLEHIRVHHSLSEIKTILDDNGMKHLELEFLTDWFVDGARRRESDSRRRKLLEASAALGAKHIKVGDFYSTPTTMPRLIDEFGALCRDADDFGATIGFEFMDSAMLPSLDGALQMVDGAGAKNGGLILDIVHFMLLKIPFEAARHIPLRYLVSVELNDGALPGSRLHDPARARRFCGEGDWDGRGFIDAIRATGYKGPWAVEVFSEELTKLPLELLSRRAFDTTIPEFVR